MTRHCTGERNGALPYAGAEGELPLEVKHGDRGCTVTVRGELDAASATRVRVVLEPLSNTCRDLTLDLSDVGFLDSAGLGVILDLCRAMRARDAELAIRDSERGNVGRALRHAGLEPLLISSEA